LQLVRQVAIGSRRVAIGPSSCNWFTSSCNWSVKLQLVKLRSCNRRVCVFVIQNAPGCILVSPYIFFSAGAVLPWLATRVWSVQKMCKGLGAQTLICCPMNIQFLIT
jgi:hypothetical protein